MSTTDEEAYKRWKRRIPLLYDWFLNTSLTWPSLACRWGPTVNEQAFKWTQRIYVSEQVSDKRDCNKLCVWTADLCKPMVCSAESCATWCDVKSAHIKQHKTIFHPGEVNKIRDLAVLPDIIITHTDAPELLVWNLAAQPDRKQGGEGRSRRERQVSVPELKLMGHEDDAKFAMDTASAAPVVASGGDDGLVLTWNLADAQSSLAGSSGGDTAPTLTASVRLRGHSATIESVSMKKGSAEQLVSVGDDALLLVWDTRTGTQPQLRVEEAHGQGVDIHCVHWNPLNENLLVSGCSSGTLKVWDLRKLGGGGGGGAMLQLPAVSEGETLNVEWNPNRASVFASGGADQAVCLWDLERSADARGYRPLPGVPLELMFQHAGHRSQVVDIQWHASDTWTMMSVSDESHLDKGGGTLNLWRPISLITRPFDEAVSMLEQYREYIISGKKPQLSKDDPGAAAAAGPAPNCSAPQSGGDNAPAPAGPTASPPAAGAPAAAEPAAQRAATSAPGASSEPAPGGTATLPPPIDSGPAADSALATPDAEPSGDPARAADDGGGATATNPPADVEMSDAPEASASLPAAASDAASDAPAP